MDLDALGRNENISWVWSGNYQVLQPSQDRLLIHLSPGGSDATVVREFDINTKSFIPVEKGGFYVPEAKTNIFWRTKESVFVGTRFLNEKDDGLTDSGYSRMVKLWKRGTKLSNAVLIFESRQEDNYAYGNRHEWQDSDGTEHFVDYVRVSTSFNTVDFYIVDNKTSDLIKLLIPDGVGVSFHLHSILVKLKISWTYNKGAFEVGSLLRAKLSDVVRLSKQLSKRDSSEMADLFHILFKPSSRTSLKQRISTKNFVVLHVLDNLQSRLIKWKYKEPDTWTKETEACDDSKDGSFDVINIAAVDSRHSDAAFISASSFTKPPTLYYSDNINKIVVGKNYGIKLQKRAASFNADGIQTEQRWVNSKDGTPIPYFLVGKDLALKSHGPRKTLLHGYGGFWLSKMPSYSAILGTAWLEKGGL